MFFGLPFRLRSMNGTDPTSGVGRSTLAKWPKLASVSDTSAPNGNRFVQEVGPTAAVASDRPELL